MARHDKQVAFRLPANLVEQLDQFADTISDTAPGMRVTRADVVRMFLVKGLDDANITGAAIVSRPTDRLDRFNPWDDSHRNPAARIILADD